MSDSIVPDANEQLATGWEPETATDDTLVRQAVHLHAAWPTTVAKAIGRPWWWSNDWAGAFIADRGALSNAIVLLRPPADVGRLLGEVSELIPPSSPYFLLSPWQAPGLTPHGLVRLGHPPLMVRFPAAHDVPTRAGVEVYRGGPGTNLLARGHPGPERGGRPMHGPAVRR